MTSLADAFSNEERARFANDSLAIGVVIKIFVVDTTPPKEKRVIVMGESFDRLLVATVYINTELNENVFPTDELKSLNPQFLSENRDYLAHDSYVDCSNLHPIKKELLANIIAGDPSRVLGNLSGDDLKQLRSVIKSAKTIKPSLKKTFGLFL
ncbi:hypothetical protein [Hufsiella ginkgonis]|uniref:Type II toxin-antitoxin system PemK/MazF family toxin n=1 Tax=Hufsiella ginkgonis TaxID=2695274 RepID=A0A7K1XTL8_9SPHI|nr:hypothetical protein [Hufsiella ginkgonis]MXV14314.1 hypothetical protein [Hufsiella ginkgonis]